MKLSRAYIINIFTTGFIVLTLFSIALFWPVWLCNDYINGSMPSDARILNIRPSGLVPPEIENDPNVVRHSSVFATYDAVSPLFDGLGIVSYPADRMPGGPASDLYLFDKSVRVEPDLVYFDSAIGQIVSSRYHTQKLADGRIHSEKLTLYAGPEGISDKPDRSLGRFNSLIISASGTSWNAWIAYDKNLRRFFAVDFQNKTVIKGPELPKANPTDPFSLMPAQ